MAEVVIMAGKNFREKAGEGKLYCKFAKDKKQKIWKPYVFAMNQETATKQNLVL